MHMPAGHCSTIKHLTKYTGGIVVLNMKSPLKFIPKGEKKTDKKVQMPLLISLVHEMGHAMQNTLKREWYEELFATFQNKKKSDKARSRRAQKTIEDDNVQTYEKPACKDMKLPYRDTWD